MACTRNRYFQPLISPMTVWLVAVELNTLGVPDPVPDVGRHHVPGDRGAAVRRPAASRTPSPVRCPRRGGADRRRARHSRCGRCARGPVQQHRQVAGGRCPGRRRPGRRLRRHSCHPLPGLFQCWFRCRTQLGSRTCVPVAQQHGQPDPASSCQIKDQVTIQVRNHELEGAKGHGVVGPRPESASSLSPRRTDTVL